VGAESNKGEEGPVLISLGRHSVQEMNEERYLRSPEGVTLHIFKEEET